MTVSFVYLFWKVYKGSPMQAWSVGTVASVTNVMHCNLKHYFLELSIHMYRSAEEYAALVIADNLCDDEIC